MYSHMLTRLIEVHEKFVLSHQMAVCLYTPKDRRRVVAVAVATNARDIESKQTCMPLKCDQSFQVHTNTLYAIMA